MYLFPHSKDWFCFQKAWLLLFTCLFHWIFIGLTLENCENFTVEKETQKPAQMSSVTTETAVVLEGQKMNMCFPPNQLASPLLSLVPVKEDKFPFLPCCWDCELSTQALPYFGCHRYFTVHHISSNLSVTAASVITSQHKMLLSWDLTVMIRKITIFCQVILCNKEDDTELSQLPSTSIIGDH